MEAGIELGLNYPNPIVYLKLSREIALEAFATTKKEKNEWNRVAKYRRW